MRRARSRLTPCHHTPTPSTPAARRTVPDIERILRDGPTQAERERAERLWWTQWHGPQQQLPQIELPITNR
jgi:hypothetical protein